MFSIFHNRPSAHRATSRTSSSSKLIFGRKNAHKAEILRGMARALFVVTWAVYEEERGRRLGPVDIMDVAPATPSPARTAAKILAKRFEVSNHGKTMSDLYADALNAGRTSSHSRRGTDPDTFGHYMAMQALGHGVSWFDDNPKFPVHIPHFEFAKTSSKHYYFPRS